MSKAGLGSTSFVSLFIADSDIVLNDRKLPVFHWSVRPICQLILIAGSQKLTSVIAVKYRIRNNIRK